MTTPTQAARLGCRLPERGPWRRRNDRARCRALRAHAPLERFDGGAARDTYRDAFIASFFTGRLASDTPMSEIAAAVRSALPAVEPRSATDELLDAFALLIHDGWAAGAANAARALADFLASPTTTCAGSSSRSARPSICGTTPRGKPSASGSSKPCAAAASSGSCRWRTPRGSAGNCSPAISRPHRRGSLSRTRCRRRSGATSPPGHASRSPPSAGAKPRLRSWTRP
jgi:hypothetical protein